MYIKLAFPTGDEPVKDIRETKGLSHRALPTAAALPRSHVTMLITPGGSPAFSNI